MKELINYAVEMMSQENMDAESNPTQNPELNPTQNQEINYTQNPDINATQNPSLAPSQNPNWKRAWWLKFQELPLWEYLDDSQKKRCSNFLRQL
jgi:hypothetical protein